MSSLTPHQREVLVRLAKRSVSSKSPRGLYVPEAHVGSVGALSHLHEKGYIEQGPTDRGPRGGARRTWRPTEQGFKTAGVDQA